MNVFSFRIIIIFGIIIITNFANGDICPKKCVCRKLSQHNESKPLKLRCGKGNNKITTLDEISLQNIAKDVVSFNLSNNLLGTFHLKVQLISLQKLDLSKNQLTELQNNQFGEVPNLRRLDISSNNIKFIGLLAFSNLSNLEHLKLNLNKISTIHLGTLNSLHSLKQLDISNNPLTCDCGLLWILDWSKQKKVKLTSNPICSAPSLFNQKSLRKLKIGEDIHCKSPAFNNTYQNIEMKPKVNQVVFEGDALKLHCSIPSMPFSSNASSSNIQWTWLDSDPKFYFSDVNIEDQILQSAGLIFSTLTISKLRRNHTGIWNCIVTAMDKSHSKGVTIVVISNDTKYCPITVTTGNKGTYTWPRTVVNYTATIPCESVNLNYDVSNQKASYFCSEEGEWSNLNTSMCAYTSETTKIFEQFANVNSSLVESAKHFKNFTSAQKNFKDIMDVVFAVKTMENYLNFFTVNQIGGILMDVTNNLLQLPKPYFKEAIYKHQSCLKLIEITEKLAGISSPSLLHKSNIAVQVFPVKEKSFSGLKCTWYVDIEKSADRLFYCITNSQTNTVDMLGKITEASVTIPASLFHQSKLKYHNTSEKVHSILISMHANNILFPINEDQSGKEDVLSAVVGAKLVDAEATNVTDPIYVTVKYSPSKEVPFLPVWWNTHLNNETGGWTSEGCHLKHEYVEHVVFYCYNFGYYGVLQDTSFLENSKVGVRFKLSHPAIYVGSFILFTSLLIVIVTYLSCYISIQMPRKAKHSLINLWSSVCCLCFFYVFGIYQTEHSQICQIVGMFLHYFTLSSLLWVCVGVNCLYKKLNKNDLMELQDDEFPSEQTVTKPITGFYFVGWGVPIIVCGVSAAINIKDYSSSSYCFLRIGPPLSALYIPFSILMIFLAILFLLIRCVINSLDANGHLSEGTQATENVDLDLLEPNFPNDIRSISSSSKTASSEIEDSEHTPSAQLNAYVIFLILFILVWLSCALATVEPYHFISFEYYLFSVCYAVLCTVLSIFTLFFYCIARSDVRGQWILLARWTKRKQFCFRSRNVSDTSHNLPRIEIEPLPIPPVSNSLVGDLRLCSRSSSRSSYRTKSNSNTDNILKAAVDLNRPAYNEAHGSKINNVNLVILHRQQYRSSVMPNIIENPTNAAEVFYNPHQSIVARKFFKRQKRHIMKRNNLVPPKRDSDNASSISDLKNLKHKSVVDQNMFGTNSKVNNTNIHVERVHVNREKNPNIFSDVDDDNTSTNDLPVEKVVSNVERLRRKEVCKPNPRKKENTADTAVRMDNNMRSVSQQCTLEYSSENISDSVLDEISVEKLSNNDSPHDTRRHYNLEGLKSCKGKSDCVKYKDDGAENIYDPYELVPSSVSYGRNENNKEAFKIYANSAQDVDLQKGVHSRTSSVSASDLDESYQKLRNCSKKSTIHPTTFLNYFSITRNSPCFSDSDMNSYVTDHIERQRAYNSNSSDNVKTTTYK